MQNNNDDKTTVIIGTDGNAEPRTCIHYKHINIQLSTIRAQVIDSLASFPSYTDKSRQENY